jgi:hypothetical protein
VFYQNETKLIKSVFIGGEVSKEGNWTSIISGEIKHPLKDSKNSKLTDKLSMATAQLPQDFKEFLKLLNEEQLEYLLLSQ